MNKLVAILLATVSALAPSLAQDKVTSRITVNYRQLVSRADLDYDKPATRSEEGIPVGNGRMGSLVWTTPSALKFQINRVDVFAEHAATTSFPRADTDYAGGCGYIDINLAGAGEDVYTEGAFRQHLSVYDGLMTTRGKGVTARVLAWNERDVMAIEIEDRRIRPEPVNVDLRMLRYMLQYIPGKNYELAANHAVAVQTAEHTATSKLDIRAGRIILTQQFREADFFDASAVAVGVIGRAARARYLNESTVQLSTAPGKGRFTILVSSAASFDSTQDVAALALSELEAAAAKGFEGLLATNLSWWHDFWSKGFIHLHSADGQADFVERHYTYFLYLMASSSRGKYPPRFGGMLWRTTGDMSRWGSQYWWANTGAYYTGLMPANRLELMNPMFSMYTGMYDSCALAARQQWGSQGIWIPEIVFFDGLEKLPDDIATELQDLMLTRKPYEQRSARFQAFAEVRNRHHARWNFQNNGNWIGGHYVVPTKGSGIFGHCTHILGAGVRIASLYWQKYEHTMDRAWLKDRAYPMLKGMAEFYRNFPNFQKGADGKYHIHHVNSGEQGWNTSDSVYEVNCLHMIFPLAIRSAELLGVDAELRAQWQEIKENLVAAPGADYRGGYPTGFIYEGEGAIEPLGVDVELKRRFLGFNRLGSFIDVPGIGGAQIFRNRLRLREGPGAIDAENIGALSGWIHSALLQNASARPGEAPLIRLFSSWPRDWDTEFRLLAPGAMIVTAARRQGGAIPFMEVQSQAGGECRLVNPWKDARVTLYRDRKRSEDMAGDPLVFPTRKGETILLTPYGSNPAQMQVPAN